MHDAGGRRWKESCGLQDPGDSPGEAINLISEIPLFQIGRVLLPDSSFPLQIFSQKQDTQSML
jgi:hypothetical protein